MSSPVQAIVKQNHHERQELCTTRPQYRQGRKLTAVKVYTINDESRHMLIHGVPAIAVAAELHALCQRFGLVEELKRVDDYPSEKFCEVFYVKFRTIQSARFAKVHLDDRSFYGGVLHVCYAPELETLEDTRDKLMLRSREIRQRLNPTKQPDSASQTSGNNSNCWLPSVQPTSDVLLNGDDHVYCYASESQSVPSESNAALRHQRPAPVKRIVYHHREGGGVSLFKKKRIEGQ